MSERSMSERSMSERSMSERSKSAQAKWRDTEFVQGYWRLADWGMSTRQLIDFIEAHIDLGITTVDHADIYGDYRCEALFGEAMQQAPHLRNQLKLVTKCGIALVSTNYPDRIVNHYNTTPEHIRQSVENSLRLLSTDHIDLLLIHRPDHLMDADAVAEAFNAIQKSGKVGQFGVSNFTPMQYDLLQSRLDTPLHTNQIEINPLSLGVFQDGSLEHLQLHGVRPMAWSPLAGGRILHEQSTQAQRVRATLATVAHELGDFSLSQMVYAWIRQLPVNPMVVIGSGKTARIAEALASKDIQLSPEQWYRIWVAATGTNVP
jgi:predicted oxidoreductase